MSADTDKYRKGLQREVVSMRRRGKTKGEISRVLGVDNDFINKAITDAVMPEGRSWEPDYSDSSEIGGY